VHEAVFRLASMDDLSENSLSTKERNAVTIQDPDTDAAAFADFGALLDQYDYTMPSKGDVLEGRILSVDDNFVIIDVGLKRDAFVPRADLDRLDEATLASLEPGAAVMMVVMYPHDYDGNLIVSINRALERADWAHAEEILASKELIEAEVIGQNRGGLVVQVGRLEGFVPQSHVTSIGRGVVEDALIDAKKSLLGETISLRVIEVDRAANRLILSEREARRASRQAKLAELTVGDVVQGKIVNLVDFGAFVDIGGIDGLVHISRLDREFIQHPSEGVSVGDEVTVRIDGVDVDRERLTLNRAVLLPSPWHDIEEHFEVGQIVEGEVVRVVEFGVFVSVPHDLVGLVHASEMTTATNARAGDRVLVRILNIDTERQRLGLSLDKVTAEEREAWGYERLTSDEDEAEPEMAAEVEETDSPKEDNEPQRQLGESESETEAAELDVVETDIQMQDDEPQMEAAESEPTLPAEMPVEMTEQEVNESHD
jgi:small subunit ribosomal protein S1